MNTHEMIEKFNADIARLTAERRALDAGRTGITARIATARTAVRQAQIDAVIDPSGSATKAAAALSADLERLLEEESAAIDRSRVLGDAIAALQAQRAPLLAQTDRVRVEALIVKLRTRVDAEAEGFKAYIRDVVALDRLTSTLRLPDERLLAIVLKAAGVSERVLNLEGRAFADAIRAGKAEV